MCRAMLKLLVVVALGPSQYGEQGSRDGVVSTVPPPSYISAPPGAWPGLCWPWEGRELRCDQRPRPRPRPRPCTALRRSLRRVRVDRGQLLPRGFALHLYWKGRVWTTGSEDDPPFILGNVRHVYISDLNLGGSTRLFKGSCLSRICDKGLARCQALMLSCSAPRSVRLLQLLVHVSSKSHRGRAKQWRSSGVTHPLICLHILCGVQFVNTAMSTEPPRPLGQ